TLVDGQRSRLEWTACTGGSFRRARTRQRRARGNGPVVRNRKGPAPLREREEVVASATTPPQRRTNHQPPQITPMAPFGHASVTAHIRKPGSGADGAGAAGSAGLAHGSARGV